jgi:hypothetical protein
MFGCLGRIAVGAVLAGGIAWWARDRWMPRVFGGRVSPNAVAEAPWVRVSDTTAARARRASAALSVRGGPAYVTVDGEDAAALALAELRSRLPSGLRDVAVRVTGDEVEVRALVRPAEFGGREALGRLYAVLPAEDTVRLRGTLDGVRPGLGQFHVRSIRFRDLPMPMSALAPLLRQAAKGSARPAGVADDAFPVPLPASVGDIRVRGGRVVFYRAVP